MLKSPKNKTTFGINKASEGKAQKKAVAKYHYRLTLQEKIRVANKREAAKARNLAIARKRALKATE